MNYIVFVLVFCYWDQVLDMHNLKGKMLTFRTETYRSFSQWLADSKAETSWQQGIVGESFSSQKAESKGKRQETEEGAGDRKLPSQAHPPGIHLLPGLHLR